MTFQNFENFQTTVNQMYNEETEKMNTKLHDMQLYDTLYNTQIFLR